MVIVAVLAEHLNIVYRELPIELREFIDKLCAVDRVVILAVLAGYTQRSIACALGISRQTVSGRFLTISQRLKKLGILS